LFCCLASTLGGLLFGYDLFVISGTKDLIVQRFAMTSLMEGWFISSAMVGCMIGSLAAGTSSDRFGRKRALLVASIFLMACSLGCGLAWSTASLILFRWLVGSRNIFRGHMRHLVLLHADLPAQSQDEMFHPQAHSDRTPVVVPKLTHRNQAQFGKIHFPVATPRTPASPHTSPKHLPHDRRQTRSPTQAEGGAILTRHGRRESALSASCRRKMPQSYPCHPAGACIPRSKIRKGRGNRSEDLRWPFQDAIGHHRRVSD
jgi:hypothetical protein